MVIQSRIDQELCGVHKYQLEDLLQRTEALQSDVLRYLDEEPRMIQMQGMTEVLLELRRSLTVVRGKLRRMNELGTGVPMVRPRVSYRQQ